MKRRRKIPLYVWRRLGQTAFFLVFLFLFLRTDYAGSDEISYAVNILFRIDPLVAASAMLAAKTFISLLLPAVATVALTFIFGRFFCGWVCPLGSLIDGAHRIVPPRGEAASRFRHIKYVVLTFVLAAAFFGLPAVGYVDPFSILVRGLTLAVYPAFHHANTAFFTFTYVHAPDWVNAVTEPVYAVLKATVLPFKQKVFALSLFALGILLAVFLLERLERRFFCKKLCPLGAMLGLISRFGLFRGRGGDTQCGKCGVCRRICRMGAIDEDRRILPEACNLCLDCVDLCPQNRISFGFGGPGTAPVSVSVSRRAFVGSVVSGAVLPVFLDVRAQTKVPDPLLIRPPGALPEGEFLGRCVRCGECIQVCIGNAIHPTFLEAGVEGMFTPKVLARVGYCEFNCTLCGQVCPTGAIRRLGLPDKQRTVIGRAYFDKNRCLPYAKGTPCIVCEEHCPTPEKAIKFREVAVTNERLEEVVVKQPYVVDEFCIGCGICENKCPVPGRAAVIVARAGESHAGGEGPFG